jgi:hypothetical protein
VEASLKGPFLKTGLAALVLAGLGAYTYFVDSKKPANDDKPKQKVFTFDKAKAKDVSLSPRGGEAIRLVKEAAGWKLVSPVAAPADATEAEGVVSTLEGLEIDEVVTESATNLADFGLATPKNEIALGIEGAKEPLTLLLGEKAPGGSGLYAKLPASPRVFTVAAWIETSLEKKPFDFRDRDLLHAKREDVRTLEVAGPEGSYALVRGVGDDWSFSQPVQTRAGRWSVDSLLGTLEGLRMDSIATESAKDLKVFGLVKPARHVAIALADGRTLRLELGAAAPGEKKYYAREASSPLVAVIPGAIVDDLAKGMGELRAKRLLDVATYDVEAVDVEADGGKRSWSRTNVKNENDIDVPKWKRSAPDAKDVDTSAVQDALFKIGAIEAAEFIDAPRGLESYGLDKPAFRVTLRFGKDKAGSWLEIGRKDGAAYARRPEDASILRIDPLKADELVKAFAAL